MFIFLLSYCNGEVGWSLTWLSSLPLTLQGHGDLLWLIFVQQGKTLKQFLLCRHLLGLPCNCNPKNKKFLLFHKEENNTGNIHECMCTLCH